MTKLFKLTTLLLPLVLWMSACDDTGGDPPDPLIGLEILEAPETMLANIDSIYTIRCRVADEGVNPEYILCEVTPPGDRTIESFLLYDDGSLTEMPLHSYAGAYTGDIVPNNDTYTRTINGRLLTLESAGDYLFTFSVPGQTDAIYSKQTTIQAANIEDCLIVTATELSGMDECFDPIEVGVTLTRTEPDVVDSVWVLIRDEYKVLLTPSEVDTYWTVTITPTTFPCLWSGVHSLKYQASTRFGMNCELDLGLVGFMNDIQEISNLVGLPDTLYRPVAVGDTDTVVVTLDLDDCNLEGVLGFTGVRFDVKVDDGEFPEFPDPSFVLNDNGVAGDTIAGDGTYSVAFTFNRNDVLVNNLYVFRYYSVDCLGFSSPRTDYLYDTVRVIQPSPPSPSDFIPIKPDIGFSVLSDRATGGNR